MLTLLAATGNFEEIAMHIRATANTGANTQFLHGLYAVAL